MAKELAVSDLQTLLAKAGGSYVVAYNRLISEESARAVERTPRSTIDSRKQAWKEAVSRLDRKLIAKANKVLSGYTRLVRGNSVITSAEPHILDAEEAENLMTEYLDLKTIEEFVKSRYEQIKDTVFGSITESKAEEGEEHPEHVNGEIPVLYHGKRFVREATGFSDPYLDEELLEELLGEKVWKQVTTEEVQVVQTLDHELLMKLAHSQPKLKILEKLREALIQGEPKKGRLAVRDIKPKKE